MIAVGIAIGAAIGAAARAHLSPIGWRATLAVNLTGSLVLGFLVGLDPGDPWMAIVGTGFCGALTTFATFALEASSGPWTRRAAIIAAHTIGCVAVASLGYVIGKM